METISDPIGRTERTKKRLISLVETAVGGNPYFCTVTGEWFDLPRNFAHLPLATIRVGPAVPEAEVYTRLLWSDNATIEQGKIEPHNFTIHCFASACKESGEESNRYVHQLADAVKNYLERQRTNQSSYGITDIEGLTMRESNLERSPANVRRMIIEGRLLVRKTRQKYYHDAFDYIMLSDDYIELRE